MTNQRDTGGNLLLYTERLTKFGRFFHTASIDESP